jgi:hypothetical protein
MSRSSASTDALYQTFGNAAVPYLERALAVPQGEFTARYIALEQCWRAILRAFNFALNAVGQKGGFRIATVQVLQGGPPDLKGADDEAIVAFLKARAGH